MRTTALLAALLAVRKASAANHDVDWSGAFSNPVVANPGDTVTFTWTGTHNVYKFNDETAYNNCDFTSAAMVAGGDTSGVSITAGNANTNEFYACQVSTHCNNGQKIKVEVTPALRCKLPEGTRSDVTACNSDGAGCTVAELQAGAELTCGTIYSGTPSKALADCSTDLDEFNSINQCSEISSGCTEFEAGENEDPVSEACVCDWSDPKVYCTAGQWCSESSDDDKECLDAKPIMNKPSSACTSTANTATAPLSADAAQAKIDKLKDMSAYMEAMRNYVVQYRTDPAHLTDCTAISTAWAAASCDSDQQCDSSSTADTACCEANSGGEQKERCNDAPEDWRKSQTTSGLDNPPTDCCDICADTSKENTDQYADRCTAGQLGPSVVAICNKYTTNSGADEHCYCGEPIAYLTADSGVEPITCGNENLDFDPKGSCNLLPATVEAGFAMVKSKGGFTKDLSSWAEIEAAVDNWSESEKETAFDHAFGDLTGILMMGPTVTAESTAPSSLSPAPDANSWDAPSITMNDLKDKDCNTCAAMINYPQLNADLTANGGMFYINGAKVFSGNTLTFGGSGSAWITNTENNADITATTAGTLMLHNIVNTGKIVATGIKGAVLSNIKNSGTVTLTDVVGNGVEIENLAGGTIEFKGNCKVDIKFKSAAGTVTFDDTVTGSVDVPDADADNVSPPTGVTKKTFEGGGSGKDLDEGGAFTASIGACAAAVGCMAVAALMQ